MSNTQSKLVAIIMAGGSGTRFWPLSTVEKPKQFLTLFGDRSMLQHTYDRISDIISDEQILVLTNNRYRSLVKEQLPNLPDYNIIGEPVPRDTAGAVALAAVLCKERFDDSLMLVLAADHFIKPIKGFQSVLLSASSEASKSDCLYTIGITPNHPATGYGYLEEGEAISEANGIKHSHLKNFKEKPDLETATRFVESGRFYWNSGMFIWSTETILNALKKHLPKHIDLLMPVAKLDKTAEFKKALADNFEKLEKISIDFAVMEKERKLKMVCGNFEWSDVGSWPSLEDFYQKDQAGISGCGTIQNEQSKNTFVFCEDKSETVALVGVEDLIVVRNGKNTLVVKRSEAEKIKTLVEGLKK